MKKRKYFRRIRLILLLMAVLSAIGFGVLRVRLRPAADRLARVRVTHSTAELMNAAVAEQIGTGRIRFDRMLLFEKDRNGRITAIRSDLAEVNRLKTEILTLLNRKILEQDTHRLNLRLGSLILPELFSGSGPEIPVRIQSIGSSDASFHSRFTEAGINQTFQQLQMEVRVDVTVLVLGKATSFPVSTRVVVAETVIVGDVPDTFYQTGGNHGSERRDQAPH